MGTYVEQPVEELARDLIRMGDLDGANKVVETEIERVGDKGNTAELWRLRVIRAQALEARGHVEEALKYLESLAPPSAEDIESRRPSSFVVAPSPAI